MSRSELAINVITRAEKKRKERKRKKKEKGDRKKKEQLGRFL